MRKIYSKAVVAVFEENFLPRHPAFKKEKNPKDGLALDGERAYVTSFADGKRGYLFVVPDAKAEDEIYCHIGWSKRGRSPKSETRPKVTFNALKPKFQADEHVFHLSDLWDAQSSAAWKIETPMTGFAPKMGIDEYKKRLN